MRVDDVVRIDFGTFVRPGEETGTGPRVEPVYGYLAATAAGLLLLDTGFGDAGPEADAWYRPRRLPVEDALRTVGVALEDVDLVVNCHLHFDHIGGNPRFPGVPIFNQRAELETARAGDYTAERLVDFAGVMHEGLDGEAEIAAGVHVIPTPGHVDGHQSLVVECDDGSVVLAGQAHDTGSQWSADVLAAQARALGHEDPLPPASPWMERVLAFDPRRVVFAHDAVVWVPSGRRG
jgi:N-acyl homoserine lactone hydrolase